MNAIVEPAATRRAEPEEKGGTDKAYCKVLSFNLGGDIYAVRVDLIKEILESGAITRVPMTPSHIRGVLNLRGTVVPVIDLATRLGRPRVTVGRRTCIVILGVPDDGDVVDLGILVDGVNEVLDIPEDQVEPPPAFGSNIPAELIDGIGKVGGRFVVILDTEATFDIGELSAIPKRSGD